MRLFRWFWNWLEGLPDWTADLGTDDGSDGLSVWEFPNTVDPRAYDYPGGDTEEATA